MRSALVTPWACLDGASLKVAASEHRAATANYLRGFLIGHGPTSGDRDLGRAILSPTATGLETSVENLRGAEQHGRGQSSASGLDGSNRYADTLKRYRLYDCSGVIRPLSDGEMRSWFERWRGTRGKRVTVARTVTQNSLNQAWASFVDCWSEETGAGFGRRSWREEPRMLACRWGTVSKGLRALVELRPNLLLCPFLGGLSILSRARLAAAPEASVVLYAATTFGPWLPTSSGPATGHGTTGA
ncbi:hypothetical protein GQ600_22890 [Phytophthora cactorum]|nr:hypothetical protein GQ600_22890 [Phytophthora cactorum]